MKKTDYTVIVEKLDKRMKDGKRFVKHVEFPNKYEYTMPAVIEAMQADGYPASKYELTFVETYVERTNLMTGKPYLEHFTTPYSCSPASDAYWQN